MSRKLVHGIAIFAVIAPSLPSFSQNVERIEAQPVFRSYCDGTNQGEQCFTRFVGHVLASGVDFGGLVLLNRGLGSTNKVLDGTKAMIDELAALQADIRRAENLITKEQKDLMMRQMNQTLSAIRAAAIEGREVQLINKVDEYGRVVYQPAVQNQIIELERDKSKLIDMMAQSKKRNTFAETRIQEIDRELVHIRTVNVPMQLSVTSGSTESSTLVTRVIKDKELNEAANAYERELKELANLNEVTLGEKMGRIQEAKFKANHKILTLAPKLMKRGLLRATQVVVVAGMAYLVFDIGARTLLFLTWRDPSVNPLLKIVAPEAYGRLFGKY